tara:strand:- start:121 stop:402 length:282 start_codon:yes stop_codon:yes gene_type:complete
VISAIVLFFVFFSWGFLFLRNFEIGYEEQVAKNSLKQLDEQQREVQVGDYWDGEDIDYDTGEISADARASVRHPKNRDRAYSGSVERFHDGGW